MRSILVCAALAFVFVACGDEEANNAPPDLGMTNTPPDGGDARPDALPGEDVVEPMDAADAGEPVDLGMMMMDDGGMPDPDGGGMPMMSAGCGLPHATGETTETIDVDGTDRTFLLTIPASYDPSTPTTLVFGWHAFGGTGMSIRGMGVYEQSGASIIAVHPNGTNVGGGSGWVLDPMGIDAAFYDAMFTFLGDSLCIDLSHVFSYGFSFGGYMSNMLGCIRGDELLAIAPFHAGGPDPSWTCQGKVSAMISNAQNDMTVPLPEGEASRDAWLLANGCDPTMSMPVEPSPCVEYLGCQNGERVLWCYEPGGSHAPPPDLPSRTWTFFSQF